VLGSQDYEFLQSLEADKQKKREREMKQEVEVNLLFFLFSPPLPHTHLGSQQFNISALLWQPLNLLMFL